MRISAKYSDWGSGLARAPAKVGKRLCRVLNFPSTQIKTAAPKPHREARDACLTSSFVPSRSSSSSHPVASRHFTSRHVTSRDHAHLPSRFFSLLVPDHVPSIPYFLTQPVLPQVLRHLGEASEASGAPILRRSYGEGETNIRLHSTRFKESLRSYGPSFDSMMPECPTLPVV